jgi:single-strand DNA-binding protein
MEMNNLNSILVEGVLVKDLELKKTPKGTSVCVFSIATNRWYKGETGLMHEVSFFNIEVWSALAEACCNKGKKGHLVRVVGRLKQNRWVGADGKNKSSVFVVAEHVEFRKKEIVPADTLEDNSVSSDEDESEVGEEINEVVSDVLGDGDEGSGEDADE